MGIIVLKSCYPNIQSTTQTVSYLEHDWVITIIQIHQIIEESQTTVTFVFTLFGWLFYNGKIDQSLDSIVQWISMVWL